MAKSVEERFWSKVEILGADDCWEWRRSKHKFGYGWFRLAGRTQTAHRVSLILSSNQIGEQALHTCDNPPCCNPKHLYWGNDRNNRQDAINRGRHINPPPPDPAHPPPIKFGEENNNSVLNKEKVKRLRQDREELQLSYLELSQKYKVSKATVSQVVTRKTWKEVQ